jgi:flagellar biosynthesis protein FlhA
MPLILEAVSEASVSTKNISLITEIVRTRLARQISNNVTAEDGFIPVLYLSPNWEQNFNDSLVDLGGEMKQLSMEPSKVQDFVQKVKDSIKNANEKGLSPVIVTSSSIRPYVRSIIERFSYTTKILSQNEIHHKSKIKVLGQV